MEGNHQWPIEPTHPHWFYGSYFYVLHPSETNSKQFLALPWADAIQSPQADGKCPCIQVTETGKSRAVSSSLPLHVGMLLHLNFLSCFNACSITWLSVPGDMSQKSFVPRNSLLLSLCNSNHLCLYQIRNCSREYTLKYSSKSSCRSAIPTVYFSSGQTLWLLLCQECSVLL